MNTSTARRKNPSSHRLTGAGPKPRPFAGTPFLALDTACACGGDCQGSIVVDRVAALALTAATTTFTTMCGEKGPGSVDALPACGELGALACDRPHDLFCQFRVGEQAIDKGREDFLAGDARET